MLSRQPPFSRCRAVRSPRCFQRRVCPVREKLATRPVHHCRQVYERAPSECRSCECPRLVGSRDLHATQQVRPDLVLHMAVARIRLEILHLDARVLHQRAHMPTPDIVPIPAQRTCQHPRPDKRRLLHARFIDPAHHRLIRLSHWLRPAIRARSRDTDQPCLLRHRQGLRTVDHRFALSHPASACALSKRSLSADLGVQCLRSTGGSLDGAIYWVMQIRTLPLGKADQARRGRT